MKNGIPTESDKSTSSQRTGLHSTGGTDDHRPGKKPGQGVIYFDSPYRGGFLLTQLLLSGHTKPVIAQWVGLLASVENRLLEETRNPQSIILERVSGIGDVKRAECVGAPGSGSVECPSLKRKRRACSSSLTLQARTRLFLRGA